MLSKTSIKQSNYLFMGINVSLKNAFVLFTLFLFILSLTSCAPSISSMRKSIDEVSSAKNYYDSMAKIIASETPAVLDTGKTVSGKLSGEDKIVFIDGIVDRSYFDFYKIQNKSIGNFQFEAKTGPVALGFHGAYLIPKLYLFKEGNEEKLLLTSSFTPPEGSGAPIYAKIEIQLEENSNYYLLVCSDNKHLMENIFTIYPAGFPKPFYVRNTGGYKLKFSTIYY